MRNKALKQSIDTGQPRQRGYCRAITCIDPAQRIKRDPAQRMHGGAQLHPEVLRLPGEPGLDSYELANSLSAGLP